MRTSAKPFLDTNVLIYAFAEADPRSATAEALVAAGGMISVQVLNEFANVSRRKLGWDWAAIERALDALTALLDPPIPVTVELHHAAIRLARDGGFGLYDALIVAAAISARCDVLFSEDMADGRSVGGVTIRNPFKLGPI
jgi:predicted nucleic acid-binding protein